MSFAPYITDARRLAHPMGQFQRWCDKLFMWRCQELGWHYVKGTVDNPRAAP